MGAAFCRPMDTDTQDLIDALTTELEHCEDTITRLYALLTRGPG